MLGGDLLEGYRGVSITGNLIDSPKGLEPGIGKLQESLCASVSLPLLPPSPSLSAWFLILALLWASVSFSHLCRLAFSVSHCAWLRMIPVQAALHLSHFKCTETVEKVLFQFLITRKALKWFNLNQMSALIQSAWGSGRWDVPSSEASPTTGFSEKCGYLAWADILNNMFASILIV